jgi:hypothetical protein
MEVIATVNPFLIAPRIGSHVWYQTEADQV